MVAKREDLIVARVTNSIHRAMARNRRLEVIEITVLLVLYVTGLGLLIYAAASGAWQLTIPASLVQITVMMPLRRLIKLRSEMQTLLILPQLMRLADSEEAKQLAAKLVSKLIERL